MSSASVVISGGAGEGKTYAAYELMRRNGQENNCIQIHSPDDVRFVDPRVLDFVFIDDIFGNNEVDESKLQSWLQVMEQLQQLVNAKAIHLIIATRQIVHQECRKNLVKFSIFKNNFSLSSKNLSHEEKKEILRSALFNKNKDCSSEDIQQCVMTFSSDLGFPYTCVLFASDDSFFCKGASFFKHNPFLNFGVLRTLNNCKKLSLLFLWIQDGTFPVALNRGKENDEVLMKLSRMLNYEHAIDVLYDQVNEHCKIMYGVFVNAGSCGYQFTHNTVYQSIGHYFARIGHYDLILEYCNLGFFMECISVTEDHYESDRVFIRSNFYQNLVDRIIIEVIDRNHYREIAMHPCLTNEILEILVKTLKKKKKLQDFFFSGICSSSLSTNYSISSTFLSFYLETGAAKSCSFLKQLQDQLKCSKRSHKSKCKICYLYTEAYHSACRGGNIEALKLLAFAKYDSSILIDAAYSGSISMYKYIHQLLGPVKHEWHETEALFIAVEQQESEMYTVIRNLGCRPDSKCLLIASEAKNSNFLVKIIIDMYDSHALNEDKNVKYAQSSLFCMDVLETFISVGMCPTKEDIVRSMSLDMKAVESILWDLKYKVKEKEHYINENIIELWKNVTEDQDLTKKLEEIGLLHTYSYLEQQVMKENFKKVEHIIQHLKRKGDWNEKSLLACNLLNLCLPERKSAFEYLLNLGFIPNYTTLLKSVATEDKSIMEMTLGKMKAAEEFDPLHKGSKQALLQSTLTCDIYNSLIDEGMDPKAYHFLYVVECDRNTETKVKIINNLYSMVEKRNCLHKLDEKIMQLALLGAFDDIDVYTCLWKKPFKLQSSVLPAIISRGSVSQVERLISNLKDQEDWPPLFEFTKLSLESSFYMPNIFEMLMTEISVENTEDQNKILTFQILLECRMNSFHKIEEYISKMKRNNLWDPNNVILKCSLFESSHDHATCTLFNDNGVIADDILHTAYETGNLEMQSYIIAYLGRKGQQINLNHFNEDIIKTLSSVPNLCSGHMLHRAVEVSDIEVVLKVLNTLNTTDPHFIKSEFASDVLELSSERLDIYKSLFEKGFIPTIKCLLNVVKHGSYTLFYDTMKSLDDLNKLILTDEFKRELVQESIKRDTARFYLSLTEYGIKAHFEDLMLACYSKNLSVCHLLVNDIERDILEKCPDGTDVVISQMFPLYKQMCENRLQITPPTLLKLTHLYLKGQISYTNIVTLMKDYFSCKIWSFKDDSLSKVYELSKGNKDLFSILNVYYKSEIESHILEALIQGDEKSINEYLKQNSDDAKRVLPGVIRKALITREELDMRCTQLILKWIENSHSDPSLRILSSVLYSDTENTLEILYEMSEQTKASLDNDVLQTALEEAIYNKKTELDKFKALLEKCKICDTELLFEAVLCKNEHIFQLVKENLIKHNQWDFSLQEYWIASAFIEAEDNPLIKCQFESYYDDTVTGHGTKIYDQLIYSEDEEHDDEDKDHDDNKSENEYDNLDSFIFREKSYLSLKHIQRDNF
ncbi:uncharacterized protein LOC132716727 [Ruditapes philippinarum]|uniref:uncharacterized protein LOC132716727 n=1 Tax=Ruditapes philippinarum TaxID=129788 RepID=UPI00295A8D01|nr:uncharacterized protein LOC132716727 [Ruditapes philippinarum]